MLKKIIMATACLVSLFGCAQKEATAFNKKGLENVMVSTTNQPLSFAEILKKYQGKTIVIDVWASWCPDCIKGMPKMLALQEKYPQIAYVFLSYDKTPEAWQAGISKYNVRGDHYLIMSNWKGGGFKEYADIDWIPRYIVVDKTGKVALYRAIEADEEQLITTLNTLTK